MNEGPTARWTVGPVAAVIVVAGVVGAWALILSGDDTEESPDRLDDPSFADAAQPLCETAMDEVEVPVQTTPESRSTQVEAANTRLRALVNDLRRLAPEDPRDARLVGSWLDDWGTLLSDREAYVEDLEENGEDAELLVTTRGGRPITARMELFAEVNDMEACAPPADP